MKKYIVVKEDKVIYDTDNYLNAKRKAGTESADIYEIL